MVKKIEEKVASFFCGIHNYRNPGLGLMIKARAYKGVGQE